jgi:glycine cleavage system H protein
MRYSKDHEYVSVSGDIATVGITDHAQRQLGDLVFVELPEIGRVLKKGDAAAVVESVKAASDVYAPISGEVVDANKAVADQPALVNEDAQGQGWLFQLKIGDPSEIEALMDASAYADYLKTIA